MHSLVMPHPYLEALEPLGASCSRGQQCGRWDLKCRAAGSIPQRLGAAESPAGALHWICPSEGHGDRTGAGSYQPPWLQCRSRDPRLYVVSTQQDNVFSGNGQLL